MIPIFDFDGTLVDSLEAHSRFYQNFAKEHGIKLDLENIKRSLKDPSSNSSISFFQKIGFPETLVPEIFKEYKKRFRDYEQPLFLGVLELLQTIRQRESRLCLATFNIRVNVLAHGKDIVGLFDTIITQDEVRRKNSALRAIVDKYRLPSKDYFLIGDTCWDYDSSQEAGIGFVGVSWGWHGLRENPKYAVANTMQELQDKLVRAL